LFAGQHDMLVERRNQYKTAAIKAKQAGNDEVAVKYIRTAKVTLQYCNCNTVSTIVYCN